MGEKDWTEKTLEAFNDVFADIVNGLLFQGKQIIRECDLEDAQPTSMYKVDGKLHEQERDVAKYWVDKSSGVCVRLALAGLENQTKYEKGMPLRVIGYDGASYRAQLDKKQYYPVMTLVLYFGDGPWGSCHSLYDVINVPDNMKEYISDYRINVFEIARLPEEAIDYFHSDFKIVVDYFVRKHNNPDYRPTDEIAFKHVDEVLKLMAAITRDDRFVNTVNEEGGKPKNMCELLDRIEAKGIAQGREEGIEEGIEKGIAQGREEGIEEGIAQGIEKGILKTSAEYVRDGLIPLEVAAKRLNLTPAEFEQKAAAYLLKK